MSGLAADVLSHDMQAVLLAQEGKRSCHASHLNHAVGFALGKVPQVPHQLVRVSDARQVLQVTGSAQLKVRDAEQTSKALTHSWFTFNAAKM
jgi:hypothetical protein